MDISTAFDVIKATIRDVTAALADLEADAPNPRDGGDYIARRDAYYEAKAMLQRHLEALAEARRILWTGMQQDPG